MPAPAPGSKSECLIRLPGLIVEGIGVGLAVAAPIGPVNIEAIRRGLREGFSPALMVGVGSTAADLLYVALVYLGVAPLAQRPAFRIPLDLAAATVLGSLAWHAIKEVRDKSLLPVVGADQNPEGRKKALLSGFIITISNPMTIVFYFSLFGAAVARLHEAPRATHVLYVGCVMLGCLLWSLILALALGWGKHRAGVRSLRWIESASALALAFFAGRFLLDGIEQFRKLLG
jgi:L-lysine exporter family protein LysE/ArgO